MPLIYRLAILKNFQSRLDLHTTTQGIHTYITGYFIKKHDKEGQSKLLLSVIGDQACFHSTQLFLVIVERKFCYVLIFNIES